MKKSILLSSLAAISLSWAQDEKATVSEDQDGTMVMETSRPHIQPQLMTLQTAQVLESYGLGFSGSGNIHRTIANWSKYPLRGSIILGLGDALEVGYGMQEFSTTTKGTERLMKGHIKLQLTDPESNYVPRFALAYGQNLQDDFTDNQGNGYVFERMQGEALASWAYGTDKNNVSVHPGVQLVQDQVKSISGTEQKDMVETYFNPQIGITWQSKEKLVYMFEGRYHRVLKDEAIKAGDKLHYEGAMDANFGARFFLRNWVFVDAGIRSTYFTEQNVIKPEIHANFTGVIPLKTVFTRSKNLRD